MKRVVVERVRVGEPTLERDELALRIALEAEKRRPASI
jgi:hypothetical protein